MAQLLKQFFLYDCAIPGVESRSQGRAERSRTHRVRALRAAGPDRVRELMTETFGFPGPRDSHSDAAAAVLAPTAAGVELPSLTAVVEAVSSAEVAVLSIESSLIGPIAERHDLLYGAPPTAETFSGTRCQFHRGPRCYWLAVSIAPTSGDGNPCFGLRHLRLDRWK